MTLLLDTLRGHAAAIPDAVALRGDGRAVTYSQLEREAHRVARSLMQHGIRVLALAADNSPDWIIVDVAAQLADVTLVPVPLFFSADQVRHVVHDSGSDAVALDASALRLLTGLDTQCLGALTDRMTIRRIASTMPHRLPELTAKISYTSGTTGTPKGVCLAQATMDTVARSLRAATKDIGITTHLCLLPLATLLENVAGVYAPFLSGATVAAPSLNRVGFRDGMQLDTQQLLACLDAEQAHSIIVLPQMLAALVASAHRGATIPSSIRFIAVGGALVARSLLEHADRLGWPVYEGYGLTECASVVALSTPGARRIGSVGRPLAHVEIRIDIDSEVHVYGAAMRGYLGATTNGTQDIRGIATGDVGSLDADGFLHITGRRKNLFITSFGRNIQPDWVEATLTGTDSIAQAALFGESRPWNVAVIVPRADKPDRDCIDLDVARANTRLPTYAQAHQWFLADEAFTRQNGLLTPNGRNRRQAIWKKYRTRIDACYEAAITSCA